MLLYELDAPNVSRYTYTIPVSIQNSPTTTALVPLWKLKSKPKSQQHFLINMHSDSSNQYRLNLAHSLHHRCQQQSYQKKVQHRRSTATTIYMSKHDNESDSRRDRYPILEDAGDRSTPIVVGVVSFVSVLLLLLAFGVLETLPSFLVIATTTIIIFLILRTIATSLIRISDNGGDATGTSDAELTHDLDADAEDDDTLVPLQWQIDGTTLILSFFIAALLIPSDIIMQTTTSKGNEVATSSPSLPVIVVIGILGLGIWFNINIVRPTIEKEQELSLLSFTELLFDQWDQKFRRYLQQQPNKKTKRNDDE